MSRRNTIIAERESWTHIRNMNPGDIGELLQWDANNNLVGEYFMFIFADDTEGEDYEFVRLSMPINSWDGKYEYIGEVYFRRLEEGEKITILVGGEK